MIITGKKVKEDVNRMKVKCGTCLKEFEVSIEDLKQDKKYKNFYEYTCENCGATSKKEIRSFKKSMQDALKHPHKIPLEELYVEEEPEEKQEYIEDEDGRKIPVEKEKDVNVIEIKCRNCKRRLKITAEDLTPANQKRYENYYTFNCKACGAENKKHLDMLPISIQQKLKDKKE